MGCLFGLKHSFIFWPNHDSDRWFPNKGLVTRKMFPFDDVIMCYNTSPSTSISVVPFTASCVVLALTSLSALLVLCEGNTQTTGRNVLICVHCCHKITLCGIFIWYILRFVRWSIDAPYWLFCLKHQFWRWMCTSSINWEYLIYP